MKFKSLFFCIVVLHMILVSDFLHAQGVSMDAYTIFSSRMKNPVAVEVRTDQQNIYFIVNNKSFYPYVFKVKFGDFRNLSPRVFENETILTPGINRLFTFKIVDPNETPVLSYETSYYLAKTSNNKETFKSYLVPIGSKNKVEFHSINNNSFTKVYINKFVMNFGDTVFSSRKGNVTALPDNFTEVDRIVPNYSLEIRHDDGTVAIYIGINPDSKILRLGQTVYPGQPIGIMSNSKLLAFEVLEIQEAGKLKAIDIFYAGPNNKLIPANSLQGTFVIFPDDIIKKEMTKREINKYNKKSLY